MITPELKDPLKFEKLMTQIDRDLAGEGCTIPQRPIKAVIAVARKFDIPLPLTTLPYAPDPTHKAFKNMHITGQIHEWYEHRYGERLKLNFGPGRMAFMIEEDIWVFRFPKIWGKVDCVSSATIKSSKSITIRTGDKPGIYNVLDSIEHLTVGIRSALTDDQHSEILGNFILGHNSLTILEDHSEEVLIQSALADISSAVDNLLGDKPAFGLSKWSSLQASEKLIKAVIKTAGGKFSKTHILKELISEASNFGMIIDANNEIMLIQCTPSIRYGHEPCSKYDAVYAHKAVFVLAKKILDVLNWNA